MTLPMVTCPLCCRPGFNTSDSLCSALLDVASRMLCCPICSQVVSGLDKFTIHLFGHSAGRVENPETSQSVLSTDLNIQNLTINTKNYINTNISKRKFMEIEAVSPDQNVSNESINSWPSTPSVETSTGEFESCKDLLAKGDFSTDEPEIQKNPFTCDICTYTFPNKTILAMHKQLVHKKTEESDGSQRKLLHCQHCSRTFSLRSSLMIHNRVAHAGGFSNVDSCQQKPEHSCNICGKFFKREVHLLQHLKVHDEKQWQCSICSKKFTTKYFLKKHRRLHTGEMPYTCQICSKSFTFQQSYHKHLLYHTNDKPYCCSKCGRLFKELSTLHNHERIHSGEKPFSCETCGKAFRQRVSYLVHRRIHTGVMPYKCTACDKSFRYKISQRTHKCTAEPPGVVVRSEGYLVHKLQAVLKDQQEGNGKYSINMVVSTSDMNENQKDSNIPINTEPSSSKSDLPKLTKTPIKNHTPENESLDPFESLDGELIKILSPETNQGQTENSFFESFSDDALKELLFGSVKQ